MERAKKDASEWEVVSAKRKKAAEPARMLRPPKGADRTRASAKPGSAERKPAPKAKPKPELQAKAAPISPPPPPEAPVVPSVPMYVAALRSGPLRSILSVEAPKPVVETNREDVVPPHAAEEPKPCASVP